VHRDIKPTNILFTRDDRPKLADFGLARLPETPRELTRDGEVLGTPQYMAPEQALGLNGRVGPPADVYALGAVLYECLTGRPPFTGASVLEILERVKADPPLPVEALAPSVPRDLGTVCLKCLEKDPHQRYPTAAELRADLDRFLADRPVLARRPGPAERAWRWVARNPLPSSFAFLFAVSLLAGTATSIGFAVRANREADAARREGDRAAREAEAARREEARAARNADLRLRALDDVLALVAGEKLRRAGQVALQRQLLEQLTPRFEDVLRLEDRDAATRAQQGRAWNSLALIRSALGKDQDALAAARHAEAVFRGLGAAPGRPDPAAVGLAVALA